MNLNKSLQSAQIVYIIEINTDSVYSDSGGKLTMLTAYDEQNNVVEIKDAVKGRKYFCKGCGQELILRMGSIRCHHFAHMKKSDCLYDVDSMTPWHMNWQNLFKNKEVVVEDTWLQELVSGQKNKFHKLPGHYKRIADVVVDDSTVIEFQHSPISAEEVYTRCAVHLAKQRRIVWVVDYQDRKENIYKSHNGFVWKYALQWFRLLKPENNVVELYLQLDESQLLRITNVKNASYGRIDGEYYTKYQFVERMQSFGAYPSSQNENGITQETTQYNMDALGLCLETNLQQPRKHEVYDDLYGLTTNQPYKSVPNHMQSDVECVMQESLLYYQPITHAIYHGKQIDAKSAKINKLQHECVCPTCRRQVFPRVRFEGSSLVSSANYFFSHASQCDDNFIRNVSEWKMNWLSAVPQHFTNIVVRHNDEKHLADMILNGYVIKFVSDSDIIRNASVVEAETKFYQQIYSEKAHRHLKVIWVVLISQDYIVMNEVTYETGVRTYTPYLHIENHDLNRNERLDTLRHLFSMQDANVSIVLHQMYEADNQDLMLIREWQNVYDDKNCLRRVISFDAMGSSHTPRFISKPYYIREFFSEILDGQF